MNDFIIKPVKSISKNMEAVILINVSRMLKAVTKKKKPKEINSDDMPTITSTRATD